MKAVEKVAVRNQLKSSVKPVWDDAVGVS